jgi:hypothetical protein
MLGLAEPVGAVVQQADPSNVQAVLVAGRPVKRDGRLLDVDLASVSRMLERSRDGVLERTLAAGPILPEAKPSFNDLAAGLLPNLNLP